MADEFDDIAAAPVSVRSRGILRRLLAAVLLLALAAAAVTWFMREEIADSIIKDQLDKLGLDASYEIESVGPRRQVLVNVVVGDPDRPDLTIERVETSLVPRFPFAGIGRIRLVKPRLYGTFLDGELSFGALDPILFERETTEPFAFPDMELILEDGRALIESDLGDVGIKAAGSGHLRGGFEGILAATSPELVVEGCAANNVTLYGSISIDAERPVFDGPLRLGDIACADAEISASRLVFALDARLDRGLDGIEGTAEIDSGAVKFRGDTAGALLATARFSWRERALTSSYTLTLENLVTPQVAANMLTIGGSARTRDGIARVEIESEATGRGLRPGAQIQALIGDAASTTSTSLLGPMLAQINRSLAREGASSTLSANLLIRRGEDSAWSLVVPEARWRGSSGQSLLALSRFQFLLEPSGRSSFSGNFATAGEGLPRIDGRLESRGSGGGAEYQLRLARYAVDGSSIAMPRLTIRQTAGGDFSFEGSLLAEGTIPGGTVQGLSVPLSGTWSSAGVLELWRGCTVVAFDRLVVSGLEIAKRDVRLCPSAGAAIARSDSSGFRLGANAPGFDIDGYLGEGRTPIAIHADAVKLAYPGGLGANGVEVELGAAGAPSRFVMNELTLDLGSGPGGSFSGGEAYLGAVPLDIVEAAGNWRYAMGNLMLEGVELRLEDRQELPRFNPLVAHDASLVMAGNLITAHADLREPRSDRIVTSADIEHDLGTQRGSARLTIDGLQFDNRLQPDTVSDIALGLVANVYGSIDGRGLIEWDAERITSTGEFATKDLDFAAAFGPVEGVSGTIEFTDLLGFVTAPEQVLTINSFNPGIEVERGNLTYELRPGYEMVIHGGAWPFLGGSLILEPTTTTLTSAETRRYTLRLIGINAALFVERMDLANISATGTFDGRVPLHFDEDGGRLAGGTLESRPPGGNLAYIGALTYEDMHPMANFAFDALRSLDFRKMEVFLNGPLQGEIVTQVRFDGIRQGSDARQNIVTRQIARLPIRFNVNIRAPFYKLITSIKTMYDPAYVADPRQVGLLDESGNPVGDPVFTPLRAIRPADLPDADTGDEARIQPNESEN